MGLSPRELFFEAAKCMRQAVPRIVARHTTTTHNHSVTHDVFVVGTNQVPGLGTPLNTKRLETTALWDWAPHEAVIRNTKRFQTTVLWD